ncbi:MAG: DUF1572 family protein [Vicinamibacterales bacterium]
MRDIYLADLRRTFRNYRRLAEAAIAQISDEQLGTALDEDDNSIAVIMKHVGGNLRSRFTDFLTSDGEKPDRNRDAEFDSGESGDRAAVMARWSAGWDVALSAIDALTESDLDRTVYVRKEAFVVPEALSRSVTHTAYHVGQIVFLAKHFAGSGWKSLSIPKGKSNEHTVGSFKQGITPGR